MSTDQFFVVQGAGRQGRGDASLPGVLNQGLRGRKKKGGVSFSHLPPQYLISFFIKRNLRACL